MNLHPRKILVPHADARLWGSDRYLIQRKFDGSLMTVPVDGHDVLCERMLPKSGGFRTAEDREMFRRYPLGWHAALTVATRGDSDVLHLTTKERWGILLSLVEHFHDSMTLACPFVRLPDALTDEEGYCAHAWDEPWATMLVVKQRTTYLCRVSSVGNSQSVGIERHIGGENLDVDGCRRFICERGLVGFRGGTVKLGGGARDQVRVGSFIRVEGMDLTDAGLIREPQKCREWLVQH